MGDDKGGSLWSSIRNWTYWKILIVGMVVGIIFWGGFNTAMEATNTMTFCISCHEMRDNEGDDPLQEPFGCSGDLLGLPCAKAMDLQGCTQDKGDQ
jgi:hypothetical protein